MPLYFGNSKIKEIYIGSNKIKEIYVGSQLYYQSIPSKWEYIGTSGIYNGTYEYGILGTFCQTYIAILDKLTVDAPPSNYALNYIMRVHHKAEVKGMEIDCGYMYFKAVM